jgi:hypothetical protein
MVPKRSPAQQEELFNWVDETFNSYLAPPTKLGSLEARSVAEKSKQDSKPEFQALTSCKHSCHVPTTHEPCKKAGTLT